MLTQHKKHVKVSFCKTWTNNWKSTKLSRNTFQHLDKPQSKFNVIAFFVLELRRCLHNNNNKKNCFIKCKQTIEKAPNFQEIFLNTRTSLSQNFNVIAFFILELFRHKRHKKAMGASFYKTWTNNCKSTKLSWNTFQHLERPQSKFQCHSFFHSWVI